MKSVITQGATIAKAIEEALKKADMPQEFFVKILEDAQPGFLGFGSKKAKIALFFKDTAIIKHQETLFEKGTYQNLFNNPNMRKQIEQQLKELGLEIQPIAKSTADQKNQPVDQKKSVATMHTRPLQNKQPKPQQTTQQPQQSFQKNTQLPDIRPLQQNSKSDDMTSEQQESADNFRRRRRPRYYRPRNRGPRSQSGDGSQDSEFKSSNNNSNNNDTQS